uniref:C2 domain-containing protein n=1 Tax=Macrostomum lignano TaxID=282301 RepID=A0A1I8JQ68_9PLAT
RARRKWPTTAWADADIRSSHELRHRDRFSKNFATRTADYRGGHLCSAADAMRDETGRRQRAPGCRCQASSPRLNAGGMRAQRLAESGEGRDANETAQAELASSRRSSAAFRSPTRSSPPSLDAARSRLAELTRTNSELEAAAAAAASASSSSFPSATVPPMPDGVGESLADCLRADAQAEAALADERSAADVDYAMRTAADLSDKLSAAEDRCRRLERGSWSWRNPRLLAKSKADAAEIQRLTAECKSAEAKATAAQQQLEDLELAHDRLRQESDRQRQSSAAEVATLRSAAAEAADCSRRLPTKKPVRLRRVADAATAAAEASATEAASARDEATSLKAQLAELDCSAAELHEEGAASTAEAVWSLERGTAASLREQLVQEKVRCQALSGASTGCQHRATVAALESRIESIQTEMEQARTRLELRRRPEGERSWRLMRRRAGVGGASGRHMPDLLGVKDRLIQLERKNAALETEAIQSRGHPVGCAKTGPPHSEERLSAAQDELSDLPQAGWLQPICIQLQAELASLSSEQTRLQSARDRIEAESRSLTSELTSTRRRLAEKESALAETESELAKLRNLLSERRSYRASAIVLALQHCRGFGRLGLITTQLVEERQLREMLASLQKHKSRLEERMMCQYRKRA